LSIGIADPRQFSQPETRASLKPDQTKAIVFIAIDTFHDIGMELKPETSPGFQRFS
jgi:hypothetical protein